MTRFFKVSSHIDVDTVVAAIEHARSQGGTLVEVSPALLGNVLTLLRDRVPACFANGDVTQPQQRAENECGTCPHEAACARAVASRLPVDREKLRLALCASLAWGRVYGAVIPKHQWEEMRDQQVDQHVDELSKP